MTSRVNKRRHLRTLRCLDAVKRVNILRRHLPHVEIVKLLNKFDNTTIAS
jgi:hypothetical protein